MNPQTLGNGIAAAHQAASARFAGLLDWQQQGTDDALPQAHSVRPCALRITVGLHSGAMLRLRGPVRIGSATDNDVVLHDPGVHPNHAELRRIDGVWMLVDLDSGRSLRPIETEAHGRFVRTRYGLGAAEFVITQLANRRIALRKLRSTANRALPLALLSLSAALGIAIVIQLVQPAFAQVDDLSHSLTVEGFADVTIVSNRGGPTHLAGYVDDLAGLARLKEWLDKQPTLRASQMHVRVGSELATRVREELGDPALSVAYQPGGIVVVQGSSDNMVTKDRLRRLTADLAGVVRINDGVAFAEAVHPAAVREHVLPVRIVDLIPGEKGSFGVGNGTRYFVGGVLPDGAEVTAIRPDAVEFSLGKNRIVYPLK